VLCERRELPDGSWGWVAQQRLDGGWSVWREDDHGRRFEVRRALSHDGAARLASQLEAGGHKQAYWIAPTGRSPW
jgi:lysophospholipase L1-like esterase